MTKSHLFKAKLNSSKRKGSCELTRNKLAPLKKAIYRSHKHPGSAHTQYNMTLSDFFLAFGSQVPGGK